MVPYYQLVGAETGVNIDQGTLAQLEQGTAPAAEASRAPCPC